MKKIVTTVGTTLFTNSNNQYHKYIDCDFELLKHKPAGEWERYKNNCKRISERVLSHSYFYEEISRELASILKFLKKFSEEEIELYFLCSDTLVSRLSAEIHKEYFESGKLYDFLRSYRGDQKYSENVKIIFEPDMDVIKNLQVDNEKKFEEGMSNLIDRISSIANGNFENIILNVSGGYRAIIPEIAVFGNQKGAQVYCAL